MSSNPSVTKIRKIKEAGFKSENETVWQLADAANLVDTVYAKIEGTDNWKYLILDNKDPKLESQHYNIARSEENDRITAGAGA